MTIKKENTPKKFTLFSQLFAPSVDFFALLDEHAEVALAGVQALTDWLHDGDADKANTVRIYERKADAIKLDIERRLFDSFITPFDREDIYELSIHLDGVINAAKLIVREIEGFDTSEPDEFLKAMVSEFHRGTQYVRDSFHLLRTDLRTAGELAQQGRKTETRIFKLYCKALKELLNSEDLKKIIIAKEIYRAVLTAGERVDLVAEKLFHAIVKMS